VLFKKVQSLLFQQSANMQEAELNARPQY